jgi:hypothetical protein
MNLSKVAYKPISMLDGVVAGAVAAFAFSQIWKRVSGQDDAPKAMDEERRWSEILIAATLQGAIFGVVKAAVDRATASGVRGVTGRWPN